MSAKRTDLNKDRHKGKKITLRFGGSAEQALREIARAEDRTMTTILSRALRLYAEKNGFTWPGPSNHGKE